MPAAAITPLFALIHLFHFKLSALFHINGSEDTPNVILNEGEGRFEIRGKSLPEDAYGFYSAIIESVSNYIKSPRPQTTATFNLEYFNTASAKQLFKLISLFKELSKSSEVKIIWHYDKGDKDMEASGERFSKLCQMPIEIRQN